MLILHTSDLHLTERRPETISGLDQILKVAKERSVDIVTIAGDLFDSAEDAEALRPYLRKKFSTNNFEIIAIPGNHDAEAFKSNLDFGSDLRVAVSEPYELFTRNDVTIVALPFKQVLDEKTLSLLEKESKRSGVKILLIHCTLDIGFSTGDFGEGETCHYCPISRAVLSRLGYDYVLAGHFHSNTNILQLGEKGRFVYPGSPVSHSIKEIGRRQAVLIDTKENDCKPMPLQSFYYDVHHITVIPGMEEYIIGKIREWISERHSEQCSLKVIVDGFTIKSEASFRRELENVTKGAEVEHLYRNVKEVLEHPLFIKFKEKLAERNLEQTEQIESLVIDAMARLLRSRELRT